MINFLLKNPNLYRFYQKSVRGKFDEYDFFKFIFKKKIFGNIRMLDICCGDSFVLDYIHEYIDDYLGVDSNEKYLKKCRQQWGKFNFINLDLNDQKNIEHFIKFKPNFIFINGAIHHLDDETIKSIKSFITNNFPNSYFLSVDPIKNDNNLINSIMLRLDRGKFIRNKSQYEELMKPFRSFVINDFYKMDFENIFYYKNFDLEEIYLNWKREIS
jgi:hypothetical protein